MNMNVPTWLDIAMGELGQAEYPGPEANPRIVEYLKTVFQPGDDEIAWCSAFVNWCMIKAGLQGTGLPNARSWLNWGMKIKEPMVGCVTVFKRGSSSWQGHVAFYLDQSSEGLIHVLGGNQGNRVSMAQYLSANLLGFRWPGNP